MFGETETEAIVLINSKRYIMEGIIDVSADVAIEIIEQERKKIIEEKRIRERKNRFIH